ncbi:MAG: 2-C-methyl-D-erythritol 4-phosphate cytidylyltransferase [Clostridia bacterium]|nr:2-C-methyl-D-erythritol 4-phosphate cytidylyltransferase [Clostridia bacterium]
MMNIAIILSGGTGTRMKLSRPKQYLEVRDKPIIGYSLDLFERCKRIDKIVVVCHSDWKDFVAEYARKEGISKLFAFAPSGETRQESLFSGLKACAGVAEKDSVVLIHDAARPNLTEDLIERLLALDGFDGAMPVIGVKDTVYFSEDGSEISSLLDRDKLFAGQAPESFVFGPYFAVNNEVSVEELKRTRGSSEIAFRHGLKIKLVEGDENNYKITTTSDLEKFEAQKAEKKK